MSTAVSSVADALFLSDAQLQQSQLDLSRFPRRPRLRSHARLRVLDITEFYGETTGGTRTYLREKVGYVEAHPDLSEVVVLPGARDALTETDGVRCYRMHGSLVPGQAPYRLMFPRHTHRRIAVNEHPTIIEVGSPGFVPWIVRLAARGLDIPVVTFYHSNFPRVFAPFPDRARGVRRAMHDLAWKYARRIDRFVAHTIASSEFAAAELRANGIERVTCIPLGVDFAHFHPARRERRSEVRAREGLGDGPLAAFVGRMAMEKELDLLLRAWPEVFRQTGAQLALVGDGPMKARLLAMSAAVPWARFLPFERDRERLADLFASFDLFVAPSSIETYGLAPLEALASGTPVLSADRGGVSEQVGASGAGAVFESGQSGSLAEVAVKLFRSDLSATGAKGRAYAEQGHSWEKVFDRIFALYASITG